MKRLGLLVAICLFGANAAQAAVPSISRDQFEQILKEFSANTAYTSVSPPSSFGKTLIPEVGFEVGAVAGFTNTPDLDTAVGVEKADKIPHAGILLGFSFPMGLGLETVFIPEKKIRELTISYFGIAGKWTITDHFFTDLPIKWGVKANYAKSKVRHAQTIQNSSTGFAIIESNVGVEDGVWGLNTSVSYPLFEGILEPYAGIGFASASADGIVTSTNGTATIFTGQGFTGAATTQHFSKSSFQGFAGFQVNIFPVNLAAEYGGSFGASKFTTKLSVDF